MNTQSHIIINLFPQSKIAGDLKPHWMIMGIIGSMLPDAPMFVFFIVTTFFQGLPQDVIWSEAYYDPYWQEIFNIFNSIPIYFFLGVLFFYSKMMAPFLFSLGGFLHCIEDFFLHAEDAHAHLWPFSSFVFYSPVSYWDPDHFGYIVTPIEMLLVMGITFLLWKESNKPGKIFLILGNILNVASLIFNLTFLI